MPTISISITGNRETQAKLRRLGAGLLDMTDAMRAIGSNFMQFYATQPFTTHGGIYDMEWAALKPATIKDKVKFNPTTATYPLIRTGQMMRSFRVTAGANFMTLDNTQEYFKYHQLGTKNMPQRLILALTQSRYNAIKTIIEGEVRQKLERA